MDERNYISFSEKCYLISLGLLLALSFVSFGLNVFDLHLEGEVPKHDIFYALTGYYCPGCGGTRSMEYLLTGHFIKSFLYHPAVFYSVLILVLYALTNTIRKIAVRLVSSHKFTVLLKKLPCMQFHPGYFYVLAAIILVQWVVKNAIYFFTGIHVI